MFTLPDLPYDYDALSSVISGRTLHFHHDKHHATYVKTLNELLEKAGKSPADIESVIRESAAGADRKLFNNAAQSWNHGFFWVSMAASKATPSGDLGAAIDTSFGGLAELKKTFVAEGAAHFGSGWVWLVAAKDGALKVRATHDAEDLVSDVDRTPLLVCDLWEHAYYLDYQNDRKGFLEAWFDALPDWQFAASQFAAANGRGERWRYPAPVKARAPETVGA
jgi:Fe-Mn family superoxide dismutase